MKVVLSTPPGRTTELWPPLGLLYIASSNMARRLDEIKVIDAFCENLTRDQLVDRVKTERPDIFGMNCTTHTFLGAVETMSKVHEALPETVLVMGGFHATFAAQRILRAYPFLDYIIRGEAENAFPELLAEVERGEEPREVEGVAYIQNGREVMNPVAIVEDLDSLPFPERSLLGGLDYGYSHRNIKLTFGKFTTVSTSRGCPYKCTYCSCAAFSHNRWRGRSAENVVAELEQLQGEGYECCVFVDDNLSHDRKRLERICELIRARGVKMRFYCETRVDGVSPELLRTMKRAGFDVIYFGVESACEHVLEYYKKTITPEKAARAIEMAKDAGMVVVSSFIMGAPVESLEDMRRTIDFIRDTKPHAIQINTLDCLIGTQIWDDLVKQGVVGGDDWKRNHRIYEYNKLGPTKKQLDDIVNEGYAAYVDSWKRWGTLLDVSRLLVRNPTARRIVIGNALNPDVRRRISEGMRKHVDEPEHEVGSALERTPAGGAT